MDVPAFDSRSLGRELTKTRALALGALGCGILVIVGAGSIVGEFHVETLVAMGVLVVLQMLLGLLGFGVGRRALGRLGRLQLPVAQVQQGPLRRWSVFSLIVAIFGLLGGLGGMALFVLALAMSGMGGGAWGRPLRVGSRMVGARLGQGRRWADGPRPEVAMLDAPTRHALGMMWLHDASKEHGSVPAFAQLTWQLAALGAPADLLARCQHSALQEIDHAQRCFAAAETYLETEIGVGPIPAIAGRSLAVTRASRCARTVAAQTLEDGCFIEDLNADFAERARALARDPAMRSLTARIAVEEREHADLAWDILRWCVRLDPAVAAHVERRLERLPRSIELPYAIGTIEVVARADPQALAAHGRVPFSEWAALFEARRARTIERARALLHEVATAQPTAVEDPAGDRARIVA